MILSDPVTMLGGEGLVHTRIGNEMKNVIQQQLTNLKGQDEKWQLRHMGYSKIVPDSVSGSDPLSWYYQPHLGVFVAAH